jgi:hypothetical protein
MYLAVRKGFSLSAVLYLDSKIKGARSILTRPFPDFSEPRFPALYLADEFLQRTDITVKSALSVLQRHDTHTFPSTLLVKLATAALDAVATEPQTSTELTSMESLAFKLPSSVTKRDHPQLATDVIVKTILDRPDAGSRHRELLGKKYLH